MSFWTNLVKEIGASDSSNPADVVHEAQVSFGGAVDLTHSDLPETPEEFSPDILSESIPNTHAHPVILLILYLIDTQHILRIFRITHRFCIVKD